MLTLIFYQKLKSFGSIFLLLDFWLILMYAGGHRPPVGVCKLTDFHANLIPILSVSISAASARSGDLPPNEDKKTYFNAF